MRRQSLKKQKERRVSSKLENAIKDNLGDKCEVCGSVGDLDRHHICAGAHRRELANFRTTIYVCRQDHERIQGTPAIDQFKESCRVTARAINSEIGRQVIPLDLLEESFDVLDPKC